MESVLQVLAPIIISVVGILVSWGLAEASRYIKSKTRNESALSALDGISKLVEATVSEVGQTFKIVSADGKITSDEAKMMKNEAIQKIKAQIPSLIEKNALIAINNLDNFIATRIEREVVKLKVVK